MLAIRNPILRRLRSPRAIRLLSTGKYKYLTLDQKDHSLRVTINRPDLHNAFNEDVIQELTSAFNAIPASARSVVLTGAGQSFSAGADLNWMKKMATYTRDENAADARRLFDMFHAIKVCPVPVIGRINGASLGGGGGLVAACDIAFALKTAKFGFTEASLGLLPAVISRFVIDKIGQGNASRYLLTAERFDADVAKQIGLVSDVADSEAALDAMVAETVDKITRNSPYGVSQSKKLIAAVSNVNVEQSKDYVINAIAEARVSKEGQEGVAAFLGKRKPSWLAGVGSAAKK